MSTEQPGPPTEVEVQRRDTEWVRMSQVRFCEGYHARMAEPHPMRTNARGETLNQRESKWSFGKDIAEFRCPGAPVPLERGSPKRLRELEVWPSHECERWVAGFLHADNLAATAGTAAMERADPAKPPPRPKKVALAVQEDGFLDEAPPLSRADARAWWDRHHDKKPGYAYRDAGEQQ